MLAVIRLLVISLPPVGMLVLGWRTAAAANHKRHRHTYNLFQSMLQARPPTSGIASPPSLAPRPLEWPRRSMEGLRVFVDAGVPRQEVERSFRGRRMSFAWEDRPQRADLLLTAAHGVPNGSTAKVLHDGRVTLPLPTANPAAMADTLAEHVWISVDPLDGLRETLGPVALYAAPDAPAVTEQKDLARRRPKPAPERRWAALPMLVADAPQARLVPAIQSIRPGEPCRLDLQVLGYDRTWYSVTNRPEARFRVTPRSDALVPYGADKGAFLAPVDARLRGPYERLVIEAVLEGPAGMGLSAEAVVIVNPDLGG
ncbi:MAG: hypothetical protein ACO1SX_08970 [Actinomycetota bacterium]